ncbi:MAG: 50S ribosomal protein L6, partial [Patescibacteria group bacterium]
RYFVRARNAVRIVCGMLIAVAEFTSLQLVNFNTIGMSRIGKKTITIPAGVSVSIQDAVVSVRGPKGEISRRTDPDINVFLEAGRMTVSSRHLGGKSSARSGLWRSLLANMVEGVLSGFEKKLEIEGIGYRASVDGGAIVLQLGFSHPVRYSIPERIAVRVERNVITVAGIDKEQVGTVAAGIRALKKPEPYKGKGIHYQGEVIRRKAGKKAVTSA